jgi:diacylglycerol O-acyltransferase / wax synthase
MQQLNQQDSMFLYSESPRVPMHLSSLHIYDPSTATRGIVTFDDILDQVSIRLPLSRVLRRRLVRVPLELDYPYWVEDKDFDLEYHVRQIALPSPGSWRQLWVQAARLHSQPLDLSRPPWELYVINGLKAVKGFGADSFGILIKVHHAAIDGISGIELMNGIHDLTPEGRSADGDTWHGEEIPTPLRLLARTGMTMVQTPPRFLRLVARTVPHLPSLRRGRPRGAVTSPPPKTVLNAPATTHRVADGFRFDLTTAKQIKAAVAGATINDVVLTIVGGGLRRYLDAIGELPHEPIQAGVPISTRPPGEVPTSGNQISMMVVSLSTDIDDARDRLEVIQRSTKESKEQSTAVAARTMAEGAELFPGALLGVAVRALPRLGPNTVSSMMGNVCVTNVPGSQVPLYLCGARMEAYYGLGPVYDYAGPIHLVVSYLGRVHLSVTTCREIMPDPNVYIDCLQQSLADLVAATAPVRAAKPGRKHQVSRK